MSHKTITKKIIFVISSLVFVISLTACSHVASQSEKQTTDKNTDELSKNYQKPHVVGKIESNEITESSGIVASHCNENVFWTHNDSGDDAFIYALNAKGEKFGTWKVTRAKNSDWEDIAQFKNEKGECFYTSATLETTKD